MGSTAAQFPRKRGEGRGYACLCALLHIQGHRCQHRITRTVAATMCMLCAHVCTPPHTRIQLPIMQRRKCTQGLTHFTTSPPKKKKKVKARAKTQSTHTRARTHTVYREAEGEREHSAIRGGCTHLDHVFGITVHAQPILCTLTHLHAGEGEERGRWGWKGRSVNRRSHAHGDEQTQRLNGMKRRTEQH